MNNDINRQLLNFLDASPNAFFAVKNMADEMREAEMIQLYEGEKWALEEGKGYFVIRNDSAIIAFKIPEGSWRGFQIIASHCDSPTFKIKPNAEITVENNYLKLNVEKYGGMIMSSWMDRPLSAAGRIVFRKSDGIGTKLVMIDRDLLIIPSIAIHMDRSINEGYSYNAQSDMLPLMGTSNDNEKSFLTEIIAKEAGIAPEDIVDTDLYLFNRMKGSIIGQNKEFIASGRLDDLQCAFAGFRGFMNAVPSGSISVYCVFDNEETGSETKQGAGSTFLKDVLTRVNRCLGGSREDYLMRLASSFMVSADNAHALHPNKSEKTDPTNRPYLNKGIVIKYNANQRYTTDAVSGALVKEVCEIAGVPYQIFVNRSDMPGGSTLGNILQKQVSIITADIGLPQLAMHSSYETAGAEDTEDLVKWAETFFRISISGRGDGNYKIFFEEQ